MIKDIRWSKIPGCCEVVNDIRSDERGQFVKIYNKSEFKNAGIDFEYKEEYFSVSKKGVFRGMHFQLPPYDLDKFVDCIYGKILDVVLDLRVGSPAYGQVVAYELDSETSSSIFIPTGCAHGFFTLSEMAIVNYRVSAEYSPSHDTGINWKSVEFEWPFEKPIISDKDDNLVSISEFDNPFKYQE